MTKLEQIREFVTSYRVGLHEELKRAKEWNDSQRFNFIKGQLDILSKVQDLTEDKKLPEF